MPYPFCRTFAASILTITITFTAFAPAGHASPPSVLHPKLPVDAAPHPTAPAQPAPLPQAAPENEPRQQVEADETKDDENSPFALRYRPRKPRNFWLFPFLSFLLPGLDQMIEGQWAPGAAYAGTYWGGIAAQVSYSEELRQLVESSRFKELSDEEQANELKFNNAARRAALAAQVTLASSSFSAYHSFRTAVRSQQPHGRFGFLHHEESVSDILLAPFEFSYLKKPSTFVPLLVISAVWLAANETPTEDFVQRQLNTSDAFYSGAFSYLAGTHEEAMFRGFMMPAMRESFANDFWSNTWTSLIFAAAHLGTVKVPITQFALSWHLGKVTQRNGWRVSEAVFIHAWWDVIAFAMNYQFRYEKGAGKKASLPLTLPPVALYF